jgi:hypothetical protein
MNDSPTKPTDDDIADGLWREGVSREMARRENRPEGQTVVVDVSAGDDEIISYGRPEMLERFNRRIRSDKITHRMIDTGRWPSDDKGREKAREMLLPRFSEAAKRLGGPATLLGNLLESAESKLRALPEGPLGKPTFTE